MLFRCIFLVKGCSLLALISCISTDSITEINPHRMQKLWWSLLATLQSVTIIDHVTILIIFMFKVTESQWWGENVKLDYSIVQYTATKTGGFSHIHFQNGGSVMTKGFLIYCCRIPIRHFFSWSRRLLTKIFKSAETVNVKFGVYEFGDKGAINLG